MESYYMSMGFITSDAIDELHDSFRKKKKKFEGPIISKCLEKINEMSYSLLSKEKDFQGLRIKDFYERLIFGEPHEAISPNVYIKEKKLLFPYIERGMKVTSNALEKISKGKISKRDFEIASDFLRDIYEMCLKKARNNSM